MKKLFIISMALLLSLTCFARNTGLVFHAVQVVDEVGVNITDISSVDIYLPDTTTNPVIYADRAQLNVITLPMTTGSANTTLANGLFEWYGQDGWDFSITDGTNIRTNANHRTRSASEHRIVFPSYLQNLTTSQYFDAESITFGTSSDWVANGGATDDRMTWTPATTSTAAFWIGNPSFTADLNLYGDGGFHVIWDASEATLELLDNVTLAIGLGDDYTITHNGSTTTVAGAYSTTGVVTHTVDVNFDGTNDALWDDSESTFQLNDDTVLGFGNTGVTPDVEVTWDQDSWNFSGVSASIPWEIGTISVGFDRKYFFETAGNIFTDYDGDFQTWTDDMEIRFGTGAGTLNGDLKLSSNASNVLQLEQVVLDSGTFEIGVTDRDIPTKWWGETSGDFVLFTGDLMQLEDIELQAMDNTATTWGDGQDGQLQYDEDGEDAMQWNNVPIFGDNRLVEIQTIVSQTLAATESGKIIVASKTGTISITLPDAAVGLYFTVIDGSAAAGNDVHIIPQAGDSIDHDTAGDAIESVTDGNPQEVTLKAINSVTWRTVPTGTWGQQ